MHSPTLTARIIAAFTLALLFSWSSAAPSNSASAATDDEKEKDSGDSDAAQVKALIIKAAAARDAADKGLQRARGAGTYNATITRGDGTLEYRERSTFRMAFDHPREFIQFRYEPRAGHDDHDCYARVVIGDGKAIYDAQFIQRIFPNRKYDTSITAGVFKDVEPGWLHPVCEFTCGGLIRAWADFDKVAKQGDLQFSLREDDGLQVLEAGSEDGRYIMQYTIDPAQDHHLVRYRLLIPKRGKRAAIDVRNEWDRQADLWYVKACTLKRVQEEGGELKRMEVHELKFESFEPGVEIPVEVFSIDAVGLSEGQRIMPWMGPLEDGESPLKFHRNPAFDVRQVEKVVGPLPEMRFRE